MLNYNNLNDVEFEYLCMDILSRKLEVKLQRFGPGKDGGIDLCDGQFPHQIIVQVKHYINTDVSGLVRSLEKEIDKVERLHPQKYYVCCSKQLTPETKNKIFLMFSKYMDTYDNIITLLEIDDFLQKEENEYSGLLYTTCPEFGNHHSGVWVPLIPA